MLWELTGIVTNSGELGKGFLEELTSGTSLKDKQKSLPEEEAGVVILGFYYLQREAMCAVV